MGRIDELDYAIDRGTGTMSYKLPMVTLQIEWQEVERRPSIWRKVSHNTKYVTLDYANSIQWYQFFIKNTYYF